MTIYYVFYVSARTRAHNKYLSYSIAIPLIIIITTIFAYFQWYNFILKKVNIELSTLKKNLITKNIDLTWNKINTKGFPFRIEVELENTKGLVLSEDLDYTITNNILKINTKEVFGVTCVFDVYGFENHSQHVPEIDNTYRFDPETTIAILEIPLSLTKYDPTRTNDI